MFYTATLSQHAGHMQNISGNVLAFGIKITEASQTMPVLHVAVDFANV